MSVDIKKLGVATGSIVLLATVYFLGYVTGSRSNQESVAIPNKLTSQDMEHAFGASTKLTIHDTSTQDSMATSLSGLVAGLEKKVAAHPENIDQQLLLAQTYSELGKRDKSLKLMRSLLIQEPQDAQVKITFATILMKGDNKAELRESIQLFDEVIKLKPDVANMAREYQNEIRGKLGDSKK